MFYYRSHPSYCVVNTFAQQWLRAITLGGAAIIPLPVGALPMATRRRRTKLRQRMKAYGQGIDTEFVGPSYNTHTSVGDQHPYRIMSRWTDPQSGRQYQFRSIDLWIEPSVWLPRDGIPVRIDPKNPKRYEMDLNFIPAEFREA